MLATTPILAGCRQQAWPQGVPEGARLLAMAEEGSLGTMAPADGTVYIVDMVSGKIVYTSAVKRGAKFGISGRTGTVFVNGLVVPGSRIEPAHAHRVYFEG